MKQIHVQYYGALAELFATSTEQARTDAVDCVQLWQQLCRERGLQLAREHIRVAVDDVFADWSAPLQEGQTVAFMPPFAGG